MHFESNSFPYPQLSEKYGKPPYFSAFCIVFQAKSEGETKYEVKAYLSGITPAIDFIIFTDIKCYKY